MTKLIIKVIALSVLAVFIVKLSEKYFIKENRFNYANYKFNKLCNDLEFDLLFFGSSKSYCAYNPAIFNYNLNINAFNLAGQGQTLEVTSFVIDETLKKTKPKLIVVDVAQAMVVFDGNDSLVSQRKSYQLSVFDNYGLSVNKLKYILNIYQEEDPFYRISPLIRNHDKWMDVSQKNYKKSFIEDKNNIYLSNNGYIGTLQYIGPQGINVAKSMNLGYDELLKKSNLIVTIKEIDVLKNIGAIAKKHDVNVLFVSTPAIKDYISKLSYYENLEKVFDSLNLNYLNLYRRIDDMDIIPHNDFKEIQHLNYNGGFKTSQFLSKYIQKKYTLKNNTSSKKYTLDNNVTSHLLTKLSSTKKIIDEPFSFNTLITAEDIGYFKESDNNFVFILKLQKEINNQELLDNYIFYVRYFNGEVNDTNKKVNGFPLKVIEINNDKFIFARVSIEDNNISKFDMFFLKKKNANKTRNVLTIKNLILEENAVR